MWSIYILFIFTVFKINCKEVNETKPLLNKCCAFGKIMYYESLNDSFTCAKNTESFNFNDVVIYDKNYKRTNDSVESAFYIVPEAIKPKMLVFDIQAKIPTANLYLTKESGLVFERPNLYNRYYIIHSERFCIDYVRNSDNKTLPKFWFTLLEQSWNSGTVPVINFGQFPEIAVWVSPVFLLMVLIVYALLPELRNLRGLMIMAYVSSLFAVFIILNVTFHYNFVGYTCVNFACALHFFHLATFSWMNVMSYDIWWTLRQYLARTIHRREELFKFGVYSIYGYGVPLVMALFLRVINDVDLTHIPWFIKPNINDVFCSLQGGEKLVYLYIPVLIMILMSWMFYFITVFNVWRSNRENVALELAAAAIPRKRFPVHTYLILSVVMCVNGGLDLLFNYVPALDRLYWVPDLYNLLLGTNVFIILVCKPKILKRLAELYFYRYAPICGKK